MNEVNNCCWNALIITGTIWVYGAWAQAENESASLLFCHATLLYYSVYLLCVVAMITGLVLCLAVCLCCLAISTLIFGCICNCLDLL